MKILQVTQSFKPMWQFGGVVRASYEISKHLVTREHEVTVYTSNTDGRPIQESKDGYKIIRFKPILKIGGNSFMPMLFFKLFRTKNDFDIIHAHSHLFFSTNLCALVRRLGSSPLVITNHGLISQTVPMWVHKIYIPTVAKWTFKSANKIICYTENEKSLLVELGIDSDKIVVIHKVSI